MAQTQTPKVSAPKEATTVPTPVEPIIVCTPTVRNDPMTVVVVGAGGTGARVVPPIAQMLRRQDRLVIMDHDIVEDRNLARQHFSERDIGQPKALVLAQRYRRQNLTPMALVTKLTKENIVQTFQEIGSIGPRDQLVVIGCVDNNIARGVINTALSNTTPGTSLVSVRVPSVAYIDVGNERRGGQVLLSLRSWPMTAVELGSVSNNISNCTMYTLTDAMPQLCKPAAWMCDGCAANNDASATVCKSCGREPGTCGNRIDMQTVMVNHMAAGMVINMLSWLTLGIPFSSAGAFFSTLNSIQPIRITGVNRTSGRLLVDAQFAEA